MKIVFHAPVQLFHGDLVLTHDLFLAVRGMRGNVLIISAQLVQNLLLLPGGPHKRAILKVALVAKSEPPAIFKYLFDERVVVAVADEKFSVKSGDTTLPDVCIRLGPRHVDRLLKL